MHIVFIPGNNAGNKDWINSLADYHADIFPARSVHEHSHWGERDFIDIETELNLVVSKVRGIKEYSIVAKSAGIFVTLKGIYDGTLKPAKCVFIGFPVDFAETRGYNFLEWFQRLNIPTLFIQQEFDPYCSFSRLESILNSLSNNAYISITQIPMEDDHKYSNIDFLKRQVVSFLVV